MSIVSCHEPFLPFLILFMNLDVLTFTWDVKQMEQILSFLLLAHHCIIQSDLISTFVPFFRFVAFFYLLYSFSLTVFPTMFVKGQHQLFIIVVTYTSPLIQSFRPISLTNETSHVCAQCSNALSTRSRFLIAFGTKTISS